MKFGIILLDKNIDQKTFEKLPWSTRISMIKNIDETLRDYLPLRDSVAGAELSYSRNKLDV